MDQAKERGLDKAENAKKAAQEAASTRRQNSKSRRNPVTHTNILLNETSLSFQDISEITGLDVYKIIALKLKSRSAAWYFKGCILVYCAELWLWFAYFEFNSKELDWLNKRLTAQLE